MTICLPETLCKLACQLSAVWSHDESRRTTRSFYQCLISLKHISICLFHHTSWYRTGFFPLTTPFHFLLATEAQLFPEEFLPQLTVWFQCFLLLRFSEFDIIRSHIQVRVWALLPTGVSLTQVWDSFNPSN